MTRHIGPGCYERDPVWLDAVAPCRAMLGASELEIYERMAAWRAINNLPKAHNDQFRNIQPRPKKRM